MSEADPGKGFVVLETPFSGGRRLTCELLHHHLLRGGEALLSLLLNILKQLNLSLIMLYLSLFSFIYLYLAA